MALDRQHFQLVGVLATSTTEVIVLNPRLDGKKVVASAATAGSTSTITTTLNLALNAYTGMLVRMTSGAASGNHRYIVSNTVGPNSVLTIQSGAGFPLFTSAVANTDTFEVYEPSNSRPVITGGFLQVVTTGAFTHSINSGGSAAVATAPANREMLRIPVATALNIPIVTNNSDIRGFNGGFLSMVATGATAGVFSIVGYWQHNKEGDVATS